MKITTVDFETEAIGPRPGYPPKPVGVSIQRSTWKKPKYFAWGHPRENNCTYEEARGILKSVYQSGEPLLFHNAKFDVEVAEKHFGLAVPSWERIHDSMFLLFLADPHAKQLGLKQAAETWLDEPPEEQNALAAWLISHVFTSASGGKGEVVIADARPAGFYKIPKSKLGAFIAYAPAKLCGDYANGDVYRTRKLFDLLYPQIVEAGMHKAYDRERQLMPILLRNEQEGMRVDTRALRRDVGEYEEAFDYVTKYLQKKLKAPGLNIDSDVEFADALERAGVVTEWTYTEKSGQKSVSKSELTAESFTDQNVYRAWWYRSSLATCLNTFALPWLEQAESNDDYIHCSWNQVRQPRGKGTGGARTGRISSTPNFMNIPNQFDPKKQPTRLKVPPLPKMRDYILPDKGGRFVHRDYSQQELRILAHYEDGLLLRMFNEDPTLDVHTLTGALMREATGLPYDKPSHRKYVKTINFGVIYGMGIATLAKQTGLSEDETRNLKNAHRAALPGVYSLMKDIQFDAKHGKPIRTWGGRVYYPEQPKQVRGKWMSFEYKMLNYLIQGSAGDCTKQAIINYDQIKKDGRFMVTVHDEVNLSVPTKAAKKEAELLREAMEGVQFDVPMLSDCSIGKTWGEVK